MAKSNDFGSSSRSPGGWGGTGGGTATGGMGGSKSSSRYEYRTGASPTGPAIGNWNTGGVSAGFGNQYGVSENRLGKGPWPGGYATPVMRQPVTPVPPPVQPPAENPVVAALARRPAVTQEDIPAAPVMSTYGPRTWDNVGQYGARNPASGFSLANFDNRGVWGGAQQTTINKRPEGGGYTNINKNGGGYGYNTYGGPR